MFKVKQLGIAGNMHDWLEIDKKIKQQRVVIEGTAFNWTPVISDVLQGSVLASVLFIIYKNYIDNGFVNLT